MVPTNSISLLYKQIYVNLYVRKRYMWKNIDDESESHNMKAYQKWDEYIKEPLLDN